MENEQSGVRRALVVGCNYPRTRSSLHGCINDANNWRQILLDLYGFEDENITLLTDAERQDSNRPTGAVMKEHLSNLVNISKPGDILFFSFSGHGTQVRADRRGDYEADRLDEAICPTDMNLVIDDDLRAIINPLAKGVKFTMVSDCCHSGGLLDHEHVAISGPPPLPFPGWRDRETRTMLIDELMGEMDEEKTVEENNGRRIDASAVAELLASEAKEGTEIDPDNLWASIHRVHGKDASSAALMTMKKELADIDLSRLHYAGPAVKPREGTIDPNKGILITGCQSFETSADVRTRQGVAYGALSNAMVETLRQHKEKYGDAPLSNMSLVLQVREYLERRRFEQNPCLECTPENAESNFILW